MAKLDYTKLAEDLDDAGEGPTVAEALRQRQMSELLVKVLEALARPAATPSVTVSPQVNVPEASVAVQVAQPAPRAWTFEFVRNPDGTVQRVLAQPS